MCGQKNKKKSIPVRFSYILKIRCPRNKVNTIFVVYLDREKESREMDDADSRVPLQVTRRHREQQKSREGPPTLQKVRTIHHYCPNTGTNIPLTDLTPKTLKTRNTIR